jgi:hypothetical protein
MSRWVGVIMVFVGSEVLGFLFGEWFFHLFKQTAIPLTLTSFNTGAAHLAFMGYGALSGLVIFAWSLLVGGLMRLTRRREAEAGVAS